MATIEAVHRRRAKTLVELLGERRARIIELRYRHGMKQDAIAIEIGISQRHVSRLIIVSLRIMREHGNVITGWDV